MVDVTLRTIALSRVDLELEVAREGRIDLGERPTFREVAVAVALVWRNDVPVSEFAYEVARASSFAVAQGYRVHAYGSEEPDPLGRARREALAATLT